MTAPLLTDLIFWEIFSESRLQTFLESAWEIVNPHEPRPLELLVRAALYCDKDRDSLRCWFRSVGSNQWDFGDIPRKEHTGYSPRCPFLMLVIERRAYSYKYVPQTLMERDLSFEHSILVLELMRGIRCIMYEYCTISYFHLHSDGLFDRIVILIKSHTSVNCAKVLSDI